MVTRLPETEQIEEPALDEPEETLEDLLKNLDDAELLEQWSKRHAALCWSLIRHKIVYYYPELVAEKYQQKYSITDDEYDKLEKEYLTLCLRLGLENTVAHKTYPDIGEVPGKGMMEVDFSRPSVTLVMSHIGVDGWANTIPKEESVEGSRVPFDQKKTEEETPSSKASQETIDGINQQIEDALRYQHWGYD